MNKIIDVANKNNSTNELSLKEKYEIAVNKALSNGLEIITRKNNSSKNQDMNHLTIRGKRQVEYYPSTETVYANGVKGKYRAARGKGLDQAIEIAQNGRLK